MNTIATHQLVIFLGVTVLICVRHHSIGETTIQIISLPNTKKLKNKVQFTLSNYKINLIFNLQLQNRTI